MVHLLIVAHQPLASALKAVAQHAYPDCSNHLEALDVAAGELPADVEARVRQQLAAAGEHEVLVLADVFGATPCNGALAAVDGQRSRLVAGVSVPMLWRTLCYADQSLDDLVNRAVAGAAQGAMHVAVPRRQNQPTSPSNHDPNDHHHQQ